jgi:hypothetical protein
MTTVPATMTPSAERALYHRDHAAWLRYSAPRLAERLRAMPADGLALAWALLTRDTQLAVWDHLDETQRTLVKTLRGRVA